VECFGGERRKSPVKQRAGGQHGWRGPGGDQHEGGTGEKGPGEGGGARAGKDHDDATFDL
jgi:hypothetical protein